MAEQTGSAVSLRRYGEILWRRKWLILEVVVVIPVIVIAYSYTRPTVYTSSARIMAESQSPSASVAVGANVDVSAPDQRELDTLASFVVTPGIAAAARKTLGWPDSLATLMADTSAASDPAANIIAVTSTRGDPHQARDLANAFAGEFVRWRRDTQQQSLDDAIGLLDDQIALASPGSVTRSDLVERRGQLEVLRSMLDGGLSVGQLAETPGAPSSPKPMRDGVLAVAGALVLGVGLAFLRDSLDVKVHSAGEIAKLTDLPLLAAIPEFRRSEKSADQLIALDDPRGPTAEAYRFLRTNLEFVNFNHDVKVVLVTSPLPGQGKSTTLANLAIALVRAGKRVSVVEGDLRRPALHRHFKVPNSRGVTSVVSGASSLDDATITLAVRDPQVNVALAKPLGRVQKANDASAAGSDLKLRVLTSGPLPPNPGEIVNSRQLGHILEALKADSDYVLVDAPPMFAVGDAAAMAACVDGIIVILRLDETTADTVESVEEFFKRVPTRALGIVVTGVPRGSNSSYYRYETTQV
jgi:succinoglycan biosynthesis transport protein ExoP